MIINSDLIHKKKTHHARFDNDEHVEILYLVHDSLIV